MSLAIGYWLVAVAFGELTLSLQLLGQGKESQLANGKIHSRRTAGLAPQEWRESS